MELLLGLLRDEFDFIVGQTEFYDYLQGLSNAFSFETACAFLHDRNIVFSV